MDKEELKKKNPRLYRIAIEGGTEAPFSGKLGIRQVDIGQYLNAGTAIVSLQALQPLFVDFSLPEQDLPLLHKGQTVKIKVDAYPNQIFEGEISAINSAQRCAYCDSGPIW